MPFPAPLACPHPRRGPAGLLDYFRCLVLSKVHGLFDAQPRVRVRQALIVGAPNLLRSGQRRGPVAVTVGELMAVGGWLLRLGGSAGDGASV